MLSSFRFLQFWSCDWSLWHLVMWSLKGMIRVQITFSSFSGKSRGHMGLFFKSSFPSCFFSFLKALSCFCFLRWLCGRSPRTAYGLASVTLTRDKAQCPPWQRASRTSSDVSVHLDDQFLLRDPPSGWFYQRVWIPPGQVAHTSLLLPGLSYWTAAPSCGLLKKYRTLLPK